MTAPAPSYQKIFYDLRPAKQVERRMILDALMYLAEGGFPLRDYQYVGFGSIYFVDFILFHKILGMRRLLSVETEARDERRVRFNQPFADVEIRIDPIGDVLPTLDRDQRRVLWLDYDHRLSPPDLQDIVLAGQVLASGSILLVTVDLAAPAGDDPPELLRYYSEVARDFVPLGVGSAAFTPSETGYTNAQIVENAIRQGVAGRSSVKFYPLFSFDYADTNRMLTVGGVLGDLEHDRLIEAAGVRALPFIRHSAGARPYEIRVPRLTRKERMYLDRYMPCADGWHPPDFDLPSHEITRYREIYRFYPTYGELLL